MSGHRIDLEKRATRYDVIVPDPEDTEFTERISATWYPEISYWRDHTHGGYWCISGDNTGAEQLVVHPYMIEPLRDLLAHLQEIGEVTA